MDRNLGVFREWFWFFGCVMAIILFGLVGHLQGFFLIPLRPGGPYVENHMEILVMLVMLIFALYGVVTLIRLVTHTAVRRSTDPSGMR